MTFTFTEQHYISTSRGDLFAQSWTPSIESGSPIILLHDSLGCVSLWRNFPEQLAQSTSRRVIAYDRLGFGRSGEHPGRLLANFVQSESDVDFQAICDDFGISRFVVLGHSVGAGMAISCAASSPDTCEAIISISAQGYVDERIRAGIRLADQQFGNAQQMQRLEKHHGSKAPWVLRSFVDTWLSERFSSWNLDEMLPALRCPLLCIHGDRDEYGSVQHPEYIVKRSGGPATLNILENCGHVPHREQPSKVLELVRAFTVKETYLETSVILAAEGHLRRSPNKGLIRRSWRSIRTASVS